MSDIPSSGAQPTVAEKVFTFVDERVGLKLLAAKMLNEAVPGGSRWAYVFGSILLFIFGMQAVTGVLLMFYYVPTADHAYASTQFILHDVDYGWFLLSYHFWGSSAMVLCVFAHMSQVFLWGAYKKPRELIWLVGLLLFALVMGFGFTGYLLPWDQRAYWATTVGVEIVDKMPVLGDFLARFPQGGRDSRTDDVEPILRHSCHGASCSADCVGRVTSLPFSVCGTGWSIPWYADGAEGEDRLFFPTADLERCGWDGGGLCLYQRTGLLGAGGLVGRGDA